MVDRAAELASWSQGKLVIHALAKERECGELVEALREFAYQIADIGETSDEVLREAAGDTTESETVKQLAPAILRARALLAAHAAIKPKVTQPDHPVSGSSGND